MKCTDVQLNINLACNYFKHTGWTETEECSKVERGWQGVCVCVIVCSGGGVEAVQVAKTGTNSMKRLC